MTDTGLPPELGPLHPATRLARVLQQLRSLGALHAGELGRTADELEAAGQSEAAVRLRVFRDLQAREVGLIADELADIRSDLETARSSAMPGSTKDHPTLSS